MTPTEWIFGIFGFVGSILGIYSLVLQLRDRDRIEPKILQLFFRVTNTADFLIQLTVSNLGNRVARECQAQIFDFETDNQLGIFSYMPIDSPLGRISPDWPMETDFNILPRTQLPIRTYLDSELVGHRVYAKLFFEGVEVDRSNAFTLVIPNIEIETPPVRVITVDPPIEIEATVQPTYPVDRWEFLWFKYSGNNLDPYGDFLTRTTLAQINFDENWGEGEVDDSGQYDTVCLMASRTIHLYESGLRRFLLGSDDGIRLTVYNEYFGEILRSVELWSDHSFEQLPIDIELVAGEYKILLEYYENLGAARIKFNILRK